MSTTLPIGVIHLDVKHNRPEENRAALAACALEAARRGAKIIVAPELSVSGYSFETRAQIESCAEALRGPTFHRLSRIAQEWGVFIAVGIAERDPATEIFYNTALVIGLDGEIAARHRKIVVAERRWACPGTPSRHSSFDTPWGRVGVLICADTYSGLLPRSLALYGVDLLLVLANWPPSGLDPTRIWRARALENGFGVVGCNRTGVDRIMDCRECRSYAVTGAGEVLLDKSQSESAVWIIDYPLHDGRLPSVFRKKKMAARRPGDFAELYLDVNGVEDLAGFWGLPKPGLLEVRCLVPDRLGDLASNLKMAVEKCDSIPTLVVLPCWDGLLSPEKLARLVEGRPLAIAMNLSGPCGESSTYGFFSSARYASLEPCESFVISDFGPARLALSRTESLIHPEMAVSLSKQGCDLLLTFPERFGADDRLLLGVKCLERSAIGAVSLQGAMICEPPKGHEAWKEILLMDHGVCSTWLDTATLRSKRFHDRVDMEVLLRR